MRNLKFNLILLSLICSFQIIAQTKAVSLTAPKGKALAVFAEGCFWCSEHIFEAVLGVGEVYSGYAGGKTNRPSYEEVCKENTGHAEAILVYYDPFIISYAELLKVFFSSHDPTTPNQQGPDRGSSYRSIAFFQTDIEKAAIEKEIIAQNLSKRFKNKIVTEVLPLNTFFKAEAYHQDYIQNHPENPYVNSVSLPRFKLFEKTYKGKLKKHTL
jgi:peptide-methionine (S)-S-oxide reductase